MKKELLEKSLKKEVTESDLRIRLSAILSSNITDYGLGSAFNATILEDLLKIDYKDLVQAEKEGKIRCLNSIKKDIHSYGYTLKGEFEHLELTEEELLIPILALEIPRRIKSILYRTGTITVLGDLLSTPYSRLENLRGMGEKNLGELTSYLESIGYPIQNPNNSVIERKRNLEATGETLVETVISSKRITQALHRANIYTIEELLEKPDFAVIPGIGHKSQKDLVASLEGYTSKETPQETIDQENRLSALMQERQQLQQRNIALQLEQIEVTEQLKAVHASIRAEKKGVQYGKK